jgi:hypothetical protein
MAVPPEAFRAALGYWWNLVTDAVREGFTTTETTALASQVARDLGGTVSFDESRAIAQLYGFAKRIQNSGDVLTSAGQSSVITPDMFATAPYARSDQEQRAYPVYHVKFEYTYIDQAGNTRTDTKTDVIPMALPGTVGELTAQVLDDAEVMAKKYGHQLLSATPFQILVI